MIFSLPSRPAEIRPAPTLPDAVEPAHTVSVDANGVRALSALADPTRRAVFETLSQGARSVGDLAAAVGVTSSAASQHLRVLRAARLVGMQRDGNRHLYRLDPRGLTDARDYLERFRPSALAAHAAAVRTAHDEPSPHPTRR